MRRTRWTNRRRALALLAMLPLAGCAALTGSDSTDQTPTPDQCAQVEATKPAADAAADVLVVDRTASHPTGPLNPKILDGLRRAQADKHVLIIIGVPGGGVVAPVRTMVLNSDPDNDSVDAENVRGIVLACAERLATEAPDLQPTTPGSDILAALQAAARQRPEHLWVDSDGMATAGTLNLATVGFDDPEAVVKALAVDNELPTLTAVTVTWTGLGEAAGELTQSARVGVQTLWSDILTQAGARNVQFDSRVTSAGGATVAATLPKDPLPSFPVQSVTRPDGVCASMPSDTYFEPDSARPDPGVAAALTELAQQLAAHSSWTVTVTGHTADFGPAAGQKALSMRRAQSIADILASLGVAAARITAVGVGSTQPARSEWAADGHHDLAAATHNRRVEVAAGAPDAAAHCADNQPDDRGGQS